jgi:predicted negative regulator of RcsB-dependent stress response
VEGYASEKEQIEAIKRWWNANGKSVILGVVIGLAIAGGGKWWLARQQSRAEFASDQYEQVLQAAQKGSTASALERGGRLLDNLPTSNYAALTALVLAKIKVDQSDWDGARYYYQWVVEHTSIAPLKDIARMRLARVLLAKGDAAGALQTVETVDMKAFPLPGQELKGDILLAMNKRDEARKAYSAAIAADSGGADQSRLQMKLAEVSGQGAP